ncbi:MAG TPA: hypothetical protein VHB21_12180 [Minicystis sp.]|nr:hypothetical protein [Minicystis sp.]
MLRSFAALAAAAFVVAVSASACAPSPKTVPCENDGQCAKISSEYHYCLQAVCVECVGAPDCGEGNLCVAGSCVRRCKDARDCKDGETCEGKTCKKSE